ncbi:MAG: BLUF domain-containing protein [Burkholderiales bacterium]|nr:MAG: BLUF domain-containing protein [Burkholderiales bacterium]
MSDIHRLIYVSAAREEMTQEKLDSLLSIARLNNSRCNITGLLLFHDGSFFQVLEGEKAAVLKVFATIERDARHSRVLVMQTKSVPDRAFADWSMGFMRAHDLRPDQKDGLLDLSKLVAREQRTNLSSSPSVSVHIDAFLNSFREFAEI